jgi:hypothetical protein
MLPAERIHFILEWQHHAAFFYPNSLTIETMMAM